MKNNTEIKRIFFNSLKCGTGEAYQILKNNIDIDFSSYIIKGALNNYAYDGQSENSRAKYIFELISISKNKDKIRKAILNGLANEQKDTWSLTQLFDLVKLYAKQGDKEARKAIYHRFLTKPIQGSDWVGFQEILELDGLKGLIYISEKFGKIINENPEDWQDGSIIRHFQDENPDINITYELEKEAKTNKYVKIYLDNIKKTENNWKKHKAKSQTFKDIIDEVLNSKPFIFFKRRKQLNDLELQIISEHLINVKNKEEIEKLLAVFTDRKFPLNSEFILKLAKQKSTSKYRIQEYAIDALKFLKSENIRDFALSRIPKTNSPNIFTNILISNYKKGDYKLLSRTATKFTNEHIIENLARSYSDIYTSNKTIECKEPLEIIYRKMNCGIHRNVIVKILIDNNVISSKIKEEIKYDSYEETRMLKTKAGNKM